MGLFRHKKQILSQTSATAEGVTGGTYLVRDSTADDVRSSSQGWAAVLQGTMAGSSSPTTDAVIQGSWDDGSTWGTIASFTQVTSAGGIHEVKAISFPAPRMRMVVSSGGDGTFLGAGYIVSDGAFQATLQS